MLQNILITIHLIVVVALVAVVLMQRSEGGGLGIGGSSGGFMTGRGQANLLTRTTGGLALAFFITSLLLTVLANYHGTSNSLLPTSLPVAPTTTQGAPAPVPAAPPANNGSLFDQLQGQKPATPAAPAPAQP